MLKQAKMLLISLSVTVISCDLETSSPSNLTLEENTNYLIVTAGDGETGSLAAIELGTLSVETDLLFPHSDARPVVAGDELYVINRFGADSITKLNDSFTAVFDESVGTSMNPHDLVEFTGDTGIVTLYGGDALALINLDTGAAAGEVDLVAYADGDGIPEMSALVRHGDYIYTAIQNLDRTGSWGALNNGRLIRVATTDESVTELTAMPFRNPFSDFQLYSDDNGEDFLVISCVGSLGGAGDGGVIRYNIAEDEYDVLLTEDDAGGYDLLRAAIISDDLGVVTLSDKSTFETALAEFNPATGAIGEIIVDFGSSKVTSLLVFEERVYVAQGSTDNAGVRIFDSSDWSEVTDGPVSVGLPPKAMTVFEN